jgi:hypothetical protein
MFGLRLPLRASVAPRLAGVRWARLVLTCAWLALACGLAALHTLPGSAGAPQLRADYGNQPPRILLHRDYLGDGVWLLYGHVYDEQHAGITVHFTGGPLAEPEQATTDNNGNFYWPVDIIAPGAIYANCTDCQEAAAPEVWVVVGF